jgi:hypothetical protein
MGTKLLYWIVTGPSFAVYDYNLTLCRLQHMYHGQPYARVDLSPTPESTLSPSQGLRIWPLGNRVMVNWGGVAPPAFTPPYTVQ